MNFLKNFMEKKKNKLITHSGSFHADEVFACATLCILFEKKGEDFEITRTRDEEKIKEGDYVFDVGGIYNPDINRFDHHQIGGAGKRDNGIEYSSFGLVWKKFGAEVSNSAEVAKIIDERLVQAIDADDNGIDIFNPKITGVSPYGIYEAINAFHPSFKKIVEDIDSAFMEALEFAKVLIKKEIVKAQDQEDVHQYIEKEIKKLPSGQKLLVLDEYVPRVEIWIEMLKHSDILFVVSPGNPQSNMWRVLALRDDMNSFKTRKDLPSAWGGQREEDLQKVTGVPDAVFCHRNLFMTVAKSREGAEKLAEIALET